MKIFLLITFQLILTGYLFAQKDTVRWYYQNDNSIRRTSNNPAIESYPTYNRNELVIVETYDSKNRLLKRVTTIDEKCYAGNYFEFDMDLEVEVTGNYLNCGLKDGVWHYVAINGDTIAKERWSNGAFLEEIIEQKYNSIWSYRLMIDEKEYDGEAIDIDQNFRMTIILLFKNDQEPGRQHVIKSKLLRGSKVINERHFKSDIDFNDFDHYSWCKTNKLKSGDRISLSVHQILETDKLIGFSNIIVE